MTLETAKKLRVQGHELRVESGVSVAAVIDVLYEAAGAKITDRAGW